MTDTLGMAELAPDPNRLWREPEQARVTRLLWIGVTIAACLGALLSQRPSDAAICLAIAGAWNGFYFTRWRRVGVQLLPDKVIVRNPLRTQSFAIGDVLEFSLGRWVIFRRVGLLHLRDASVVHISAIQGADPLIRPHYRAAEDVVDELNAMLDRMREGESPRRGLALRKT